MLSREPNEGISYCAFHKHAKLKYDFLNSSALLLKGCLENDDLENCDLENDDLEIEYEVELKAKFIIV